jgi:hypothetical protein
LDGSVDQLGEYRQFSNLWTWDIFTFTRFNFFQYFWNSVTSSFLSSLCFL